MKRIFILIMSMFFLAGAAFALHCSRCNYDNPYGAPSCIQCGIPLQASPQIIYCSNCGFGNSYGAYYCTRCGAPLQEVAPAPVAPVPVNFVSFGGHSHKKHQSKSQWRYIATISANGDSKAVELPGGGSISHFKLKGTAGSLIIDTLVIREGGNAEHFPISTQFSPGQEVNKDLSRIYNSTGFRVSRRGSGSVELYVQ